MYDPQILIIKVLGRNEARKLCEKHPQHPLLKYADMKDVATWEEFLNRFGGCSVNHTEHVAQAYSKYYLILKKECRGYSQVVPSVVIITTSSFHNRLADYA